MLFIPAPVVQQLTITNNCHKGIKIVDLSAATLLVFRMWAQGYISTVLQNLFFEMGSSSTVRRETKLLIHRQDRLDGARGHNRTVLTRICSVRGAVILSKNRP